MTGCAARSEPRDLPLAARAGALPRPHAHALGRAIAALVEEALLREVQLTPKPGLVDCANTGAHRDMDYPMFLRSAAAIRPFMEIFFRIGAETAALPATGILTLLRADGQACERAMFAATGGVNTHKGTIFAFGLAAAACGRLHVTTGEIDHDSLCDEVAAMTAGLTARELAGPREARTAGERFHQLYGMTGARGEAESGFATVRDGSLPAMERAIATGAAPEWALHAAFLHLLEHNADTNLVARGGLPGLAYAQGEARRIRLAGGIDHPAFLDEMAALDQAFIARNLSPGGSADLLALTWFLHQIPTRSKAPKSQD
jgi:triphosphoribosyl-dephospho-CoA synthase